MRCVANLNPPSPSACSTEKLTSELQSRENKCMMLYQRLQRWPECNALAHKLLLKKWVWGCTCVWPGEDPLRGTSSTNLCVFSLQPWWLAVLSLLFWLSLPPDWSVMESTGRRRSVSIKDSILNGVWCLLVRWRFLKRIFLNRIAKYFLFWVWVQTRMCAAGR